jgi:hypothetical protein
MSLILMCSSQQQYVDGRDASWYNKPIKLATSVKLPPVTGGHTFREAVNSYNIRHDHYLLHKLATCVLRNMATISHSVQYFMGTFSFPVLADLQSCLDFVSCRTWAEIAQSAKRSTTGWAVRGSNPGVGDKICLTRPGGPRAYLASYSMSAGSFLGVKRPGRGVDHPLASSAEVNGRVQLYLHSPSGSPWPVLE